MSPRVAAAGVRADRFGWVYTGATSATLDDISLDIAPGSVVVLTGRSGSGKSTLGALIAGLLDPEEDGTASGELLVGDLSWQRRSAPVGVVLQQPDNQTIMHRVADDVAFGLENLGVDPSLMPARVRQTLRQVGLDVPLGHSTVELSGGQRQRLALAGAIAMRPGLIVLDEPLQALDSEGRDRVCHAVSRLHESTGMTLVIIDHDPLPWRPLAHRVLAVDGGRIVGDWAVADAPISWTRGEQAHRVAPGTPGDIALATAELVIGRAGVALGGGHNLVCREGEILVLQGRNGSGKSTLAMTLAGLLEPISGEVTTPPQPHLMASTRLSRHVSFVPQNPDHHHVADTVSDDVAATLIAQGEDPESVSRAVEHVLSRYGLTDLATRHPASLSGGEARRVALAGAVVTKAPVLVLDEPSQSLDSEGWAVLVEDLRRLAAEGRALVIATHDQALAAALGARVYSMTLTRSRLGKPIAAEAAPWSARANPLALLVAATIVAVGMLASLDIVSGLVSLLCVVTLVCGTGLCRKGTLVRTIPIGMAAVFSAITIALYGEDSGESVANWWVITVSEGSVELALATALRILAIGVPAVVLFRGVDPTALSDALALRLRAPERFVVGALAGARLAQLLAGDYRDLRATRRSRGLGELAWWRAIPREIFSILVIALRRASILATAMEARGFGRDAPRTHFRTSPWRALDSTVVGVSICVVAAALGSAAIAGTWSP